MLQQWVLAKSIQCWLQLIYFEDDTLHYFVTRDKSAIEMFPEGLKHHIIWQCLQDRVAPVVYTVHIYIMHVNIFLCVEGIGEKRRGFTGLIPLHCPLSLSLPSLLCSSCWVNCCPKCFFHGTVWSARSRLLLTGNTLTCLREHSQGEERRRGERKVSYGSQKAWSYCMVDSPFHLSLCRAFLSGTQICWGKPRKCLNRAHQLGINNSITLHCVNVYVSLVAEHCAILRPGTL